MPDAPQIFRDIASLRGAVAGWRAAGEKIALVPTMGALHAGHVALVEAARKSAERTVVSIFVNPTQFAPNEDFGAYPRTFDADLEKLANAGADGCFAPEAPEMYRPGFSTEIIPGGPALAGLEDRFRPTHFHGVALVVAKLLNQAQADTAFFGEKDFQQLAVIRQMVADLDIATAIAGVATLREADGLALSSRNVYLTPEQREKAPELYAVLRKTAMAMRAGVAPVRAAEEGAVELAVAGFAVDYLEARHALTLAPIAALDDGPVRLLVAAKLGKTRLIDNIAV